MVSLSRTSTTDLDKNEWKLNVEVIRKILNVLQGKEQLKETCLYKRNVCMREMSIRKVFH